MMKRLLFFIGLMIGIFFVSEKVCAQNIPQEIRAAFAPEDPYEQIFQMFQEPPAQKPMSKPKEDEEPIQYLFSDLDFINIGLAEPLRGVYYHQDPGIFFLGEPVVVPLRITNQTRYPLTITTNFVTRDMFKVMIQPQEQRSRRYYGPSKPGYYPSVDLKIGPFDEYQMPIMIWGDSTPNGLAFPDVGTYKITFELLFSIREKDRGFTTSITLDPVSITVVDTPSELIELVDKLKDDHAASDLQQFRVPAAWRTSIDEIVHKNAATPFTPYVCFAAANYYAEKIFQNPKSSQIQDWAIKALKYYDAATQDVSPVLDLSYLAMLNLTSKLNYHAAAKAAAIKYLLYAPIKQRGTTTSSALFKRYLHYGDELDRGLYWSVLN